MKQKWKAILRGIDGQSRWLLVALGLLVIALLGPTLPWQRDVFNSIFVIDVSQSMNTRDY